MPTEEFNKRSRLHAIAGFFYQLPALTLSLLTKSFRERAAYNDINTRYGIIHEDMHALLEKPDDQDALERLIEHTGQLVIKHAEDGRIFYALDDALSIFAEEHPDKFMKFAVHIIGNLYEAPSVKADPDDLISIGRGDMMSPEESKDNNLQLFFESVTRVLEKTGLFKKAFPKTNDSKTAQTYEVS